MSSSKRHAEHDAEAEPRGDDVLEITPLGAGSEVGRSCIVLRYKGKSVMLDCGIHPGLSGLASLPYLDDADLAAVSDASLGAAPRHGELAIGLSR